MESRVTQGQVSCHDIKKSVAGELFVASPAGLYACCEKQRVELFCSKQKINAKLFGSSLTYSYLCSVRMSSEGANDLLSQQNSSWTFLTTLRGHSPKGYVLSFSMTSLMSCLIVSLSGASKASDLTTTALLL